MNYWDEDIDKCIICLENLSTEQEYCLPECGHKFHQNCIMHWFRGGNCKCPLCNNLGVNQPDEVSDEVPGDWFRGGKYRYQMIRQYARKKDAPVKLKKEITNLKKLEDKQRVLRGEIQNFKNKTGVWKDLSKEFNQLRLKRWRLDSGIRRRKMAIANFNIIPIIIAKKVNIP
tara:strand:+ start:71 stop:586 length:516 start_codon:yes stop_codon:yes gene_type:complete